jgi:ribosomal protein S18 acetylase RimI-like enzyme
VNVMMLCRPAVETDIPAIQTVAEAGWQATYGGIFPESEIRARLDNWYSKESLERSISNARSLFLVADDAGAVVGFGEQRIW